MDETFGSGTDRSGAVTAQRLLTTDPGPPLVLAIAMINRLNGCLIEAFIQIKRRVKPVEEVIFASTRNALEVDQVTCGDIVSGDVLAPCPAPQCQ